MTKLLARIGVFLLLGLWLHPAHAQTAGGSCSTAGLVAQGESGLLVCNSSDYWELAESWYGTSGYGYVLPHIGNDAGSCTTAKTGELIYTASTPAWEYCNGSSWLPFPSAAATSSSGVVSQSGNDGCVILNGALLCWGYNVNGELGIGTTVENWYAPQQVGTSVSTTGWTAVSTGGTDTCAIAGGELYCWGYNEYGEDGLGNTTQYTSPQAVGTSISTTGWTAITVSNQDACGIVSGALYCWGRNEYGELGVASGNTTEYKTPQAIGTSISTMGWTAVSTGNNDTCGIVSGKLYCWGHNQHGECGIGSGNTTQYDSPQQVGSLTNWTAISTGPGPDTCGVEAGELYCWGYNDDAEDGVGNETQYDTPQAVGTSISTTGWTAVAAGGTDSCAIEAGELYCWGQNVRGEDGLGNTTQYETPQQVGSLTSWTAVSNLQNGNAVNPNTCGIAGGKLYCWGYGQYGVIGNGTTTENNSPIQIAPLY